MLASEFLKLNSWKSFLYTGTCSHTHILMYRGRASFTDRSNIFY